MKTKNIGIKEEYRFGFHMPDESVFRMPKGLSRETVEAISRLKEEPHWMTDFRLHAFDVFSSKVMPEWGADLSGVDFDSFSYYVKPTEKKGKRWEDIPQGMRKTFDALGIPEAEQKVLAGVGAQYDSEVVYHSLKKDIEKKGVVFLDTDSALKKYPEVFNAYFGKAIPPADNKFAALNSAVWSGGSFVYVPKGVKVEIPMQAYFRINSEAMGQFERTLIVAEEGSFVSYIEGCTAPLYSTNSLHAAVVEIFVKKGARVRYTTVQNWPDSMYNLVTKRAFVEEEGIMEWVDGNLGSKVTMKYPSGFLVGKGARVDILSLAYAGKGQVQDAGGKAVHLAPYTSSNIISKSVSRGGGNAVFRGLVKIVKNAKGSKSHMRCDALILDDASKADTFPTLKIDERDVSAAHEATIGKVGEEQLFYLRSRGLSEEEAMAMIVNGFIEPIVKEIPLEYAVELNRLMGMEIKGL